MLYQHFSGNEIRSCLEVFRVTTSNPRARTAKDSPRSVQRSVSQLGPSTSTCQTKRTASCSRRNYTHQCAPSSCGLSIQIRGNDHVASSLVKLLSHTGSQPCFTSSTDALPMVVNTFRGWLPTTSASSISFLSQCAAFRYDRNVLGMQQKELDYCDMGSLCVTSGKS